MICPPLPAFFPRAESKKHVGTFCRIEDAHSLNAADEAAFGFLVLFQGTALAEIVTTPKRQKTLLNTQLYELCKKKKTV